MVGKLLNPFGDSNDKQVKRLQRDVVDPTTPLEPEMERLSDQALAAKTDEFRQRLAGREGLDDLLPEAFAAVREAARRAIGLRHFDVQLIGGAALHQGKIAEMKTGEGKTLVATLALYLNALEGEGAHLVTVNDYLARRDTLWMGPVYHALGLSVGCLQHDTAVLFDPDAPEEEGLPAKLRTVHRREAYAADITHGTNNEFGFDYLRDHMAASRENQVQRPLHYAIVDEVDNILIDEARTPLIISGPAQESTKLYTTFAQLVPRLIADQDYKVEEKERAVVLTDSGMSKLEKWLNVGNLYDPANYGLTHFVENALRAQVMYQRDREYMVRNGEVIIVDEFTGRLMEGRRYGEGLHQAIEAKEGVEIQRESITYATVTLQNYFRMYPKLAGMTGTAATEKEEFYGVYKLDVLVIPPHLPMVRRDASDAVYKTEEAKFQAVADETVRLHEEGRPVLLGTASIEHSEHLSEMLQRRGVPHEVPRHTHAGEIGSGQVDAAQIDVLEQHAVEERTSEGGGAGVELRIQYRPGRPGRAVDCDREAFPVEAALAAPVVADLGSGEVGSGEAGVAAIPEVGAGEVRPAEISTDEASSLRIDSGRRVTGDEGIAKRGVEEVGE